MTKSQRVLNALRTRVESTEGEWGLVYLDNARPADISERSFRSCLADLARNGLYKPVDGYAWGNVKVASPDIKE